MRKFINVSPSKPKPQRTCVTCRQVNTKYELVRLVRTADGSVEIDISGKKNGRGAYLCRSRECWETALKSGRLEHSLSTAIDREHRESLVKSAEELFSDA
jgi:predicted RNA-binding protein YlxR (DUF448 family)